jgi:RNase P subunit RPR2
MDKKFCEYCRDLVEYKIEESIRVDKIGEVKIRYKEKKAICNNCGNWFIPSYMMDENLRRRKIAYKIASKKEV